MCSSSCESKKSEDSTEDSGNNFDATWCSYNCNEGTGKYRFPIAPRLCRSASCSPRSMGFKSDSSVSDSKLVRIRKRNRRKSLRTLPPIGVYWDIENCQVPRTKSATSIVQRVRELFYSDYREAEFVVVCDVKKESAQVVQDLNDAQVNLIHVSSTSKNAADEKLRQSLRRFAEVHRAPAAIALISSDINFAADLSDLRYRKKIRVILIHSSAVADALLLCAAETHNFTNITESIPSVLKPKAPLVQQQTDLYVYNLPNTNSDASWMNAIRNRLRLLSDNCGGKVLGVNLETRTSVIRFVSHDYAKRAQKRLEGEDVFGSKIRISNPTVARESPFKTYTGGRKVRSSDLSYQQQSLAAGSVLYHMGNNNNNPFYSTEAASRVTTTTWRNSEVNQEPLSGAFRPIRGMGFMEAPYPLQESKSTTTAPVELIISNLDASIDATDVCNVLLKTLKQYAMVISLTLSFQPDGSHVANVRVGTQQEAQLIISKFHHLWTIGSRRVSVTLAQPNSDLDQLRMIVVSLLRGVPNNRMPLFKFFELVESRYHCSISLSEVNKLKDVCKIIEGRGGRMIVLTPEAAMSPVSMMLGSALYCTIHCPNGLEGRGWGEAEEVTLPNVKVALKSFAGQVNDLLASHMGHLPLLSFPVCYSVQFGRCLPMDDEGVPLEHLVACVANAELACSPHNKNLKFLRVRETKDKGKETAEDLLVKSVSPSLMPNISMLCREVVDLLKTTERCQLLMSRYIPAYHHHFGRQCRVADYGFTRLIDLFEAITHVVQILGSGAKRTITLTHSAQVRRFTSDLLRVLKGQVSKQLNLADFPGAYERTLNKPFNAVEYGLCSLDDLLEEIPENVVVITRTEDGAPVTVGIPKREQTAEEVQRTKQFALDTIELLRHAPYCAMLFNKFVPAYHHHFGRQCKVSDYGFAKLAELFEAIPETVELEGVSDVDRRVKLRLSLSLKVLGAQIQSLIKEPKVLTLHMEMLPAVYKREYGYTLKPEAYKCADFKELVGKLNGYVQVAQSGMGPLLALSDTDTATLTVRVWSLLLKPPHSASLMAFICDYRVQFLSSLSINKLEQLKDVVMLTNNNMEIIVSLTSYYVMVARIYHLLYTGGAQIQLSALESLYYRKFGQILSPATFGMGSLEELVRQMGFMAVLRGNKKLSITLNEELAAYGVNLPPSVMAEQQQRHLVAENCRKREEELLTWPPPASHHQPTALINNLWSMASPKPDTPPAQNEWNSSVWSTPPKSDNIESNLNLMIPMPAIDTSTVLMDVEGLISPTRGLLSAHTVPPSNPVIPKITAPNPEDLPLPDKLMMMTTTTNINSGGGGGATADDSSDSGVNFTKVECASSSDNELNLSEHFHSNQQRSGGHQLVERFNKTFSTFLNM